MPASADVGSGGASREGAGSPGNSDSSDGDDNKPRRGFTVPFFITSNAFTAATYARIVWNMLADVAAYPPDQVRVAPDTHVLSW